MIKNQSSSAEGSIKGWYLSGDSWISKTERKLDALTRRVGIPSRLKATIRFGYEESAKQKIGSSKMDEWLKDIMTHLNAHYRHPSLGTRIEFEVCKEVKFLISNFAIFTRYFEHTTKTNDFYFIDYR